MSVTAGRAVYSIITGGRLLLINRPWLERGCIIQGAQSCLPFLGVAFWWFFDCPRFCKSFLVDGRCRHCQSAHAPRHEKWDPLTLRTCLRLKAQMQCNLETVLLCLFVILVLPSLSFGIAGVFAVITLVVPILEWWTNLAMFWNPILDSWPQRKVVFIYVAIYKLTLLNHVISLLVSMLFSPNCSYLWLWSECPK